MVLSQKDILESLNVLIMNVSYCRARLRRRTIIEEVFNIRSKYITNKQLRAILIRNPIAFACA